MSPAESTRRYKERHPERVLESQRRYRKNNRAKSQAYGRIRERQRREDTRKKLLEAVGGKCNKCGFDDFRALHIDHVEGGGLREVRDDFKHNQIKFQKHVVKLVDSGKYQLLCANCNQIKEWERRRAGRKKTQLDAMRLFGDHPLWATESGV